ncbi:MAG: HlyC/CorC family transporter [Deltaproteobacteria bacterium]|nr:HlyC/CorC family transporter [Deltaproteobacteria bacterium]
MIDLLTIIPVVIFLMLEGLFSGGEIALISSDTNKIRQQAEQGSRMARIAINLVDNPDWFLSTTLTGTNLCAITNTALVTAFFISRFGSEQGELIAIVIMIPLILVMGEIVPKSIFQHYADFMAPKIALFILAASWVFYPVVFLLSKISRGTIHMIADKNGSLYPSYITKAGLESILEDGGAKSDIMKSEREMIQKIFDFSEYKADRIMVPISNVFALSSDTPLREAATAVTETGHSRIPVFQDHIFNIIGILYTFDLLEALQNSDLKEGTKGWNPSIEQYVRKNILYVPETMPAGELLIELQKRGEQMAVIIDEYGGATGIGTVEDILEEIVGEIDDEYHTQGAEAFRKVGPGKYIFRGQTRIDYVRNVLHRDIPLGDYETIGGFLLHQFGKVPKRNETIRYGKLIFVVEESDMKSIKEVLIIVPSEMDIEGIKKRTKE